MKNLRYNNICLRALAIVCVMMASVGAWAQWTDSHGVTFTATSGSNGGNNAREAFDKACDGRTDTKFCDNFVNGSCWVIVQASHPVKLTGYSLYTANDTEGNPGRNPRTWTIEGSNDGTNWTTFVTENNNATMGATNYTEYFFTCSAPDYYQYFRLTITGLQNGTLFQYSEFHPFGVVEGAGMESSVRDGYVMFSGSNYLDNSTAGTTTFNPSTCIWRGTSGGPFTNGTNYIRNGQTNIIGTNNDRNCTLGGTESGTTGQTLYTNSNYLRYNNGWTRSNSTTQTGGRTVVFAVTKDVYSEISTAPTISGADVFDAIGNKTYSRTNASFTQGCIDYIFYNNTHHYFKTDNSTSLNAKPTAESFTYTWSLSANAAGHVSVGESSGVVSYDEYYADDTDVTLTLTATSDNKTYMVDKTIQFLAPREDPTGVSASDMTLNVGEDRTITPTLTPNHCYTRLEFSSANTHIATVNATTGEVTGVAGGQTTVTIKAYKYSAPTQYVSTSITVTVMEKVATPVIEFTPQGEGNTASTTITCGTADSRIYYTTDGSTPSASSTLYEDAFNVNNLDVVKAIAAKSGGYFENSEVASATYSKHKMPTPTININNGQVSFTCSEDGASFYYTIDGSDPTTSSTEWDGTPFTPSANECTIKVIAVKTGSQNSDVASRPYVRASGVSDGTVYINDYEDHTWTYYAGVDPEVDGGHYNTSYIASGTGTRRDVRLYSPKPRNVKITYNANGGAVSINESATEFVYYKTLEQGATENEYPYQVISNPFSKRPTGKGFGGWQITKGANYIKNKAANATLGLDEEIVFENLGNPGVNVTAAEVEFTATWVDATITHIQTNKATTIPTGGNYETKLVVVHAAQTRTLTINGPCTIMMVEPDGSADYRANTMTSAIAPVAGAANTVKIEFANWSPGDAIDANGRNLTIGRGMKMDGTRRAVYGINDNTGMNQTLKIESGNFSTFRNYQAAPGTITKHWVILGNDYDRANGDNDKLSFSGMFRLADGINLGASSTTEVAHVISKSGRFMTGVAINTAAADNSYYIGVASTHNSCYRYLEIQGGEWVNIAGGMGNAHPAADPAFTFRMRGGLVAGSIYGAGAFAPAGGIRTYIITGGEIGGWIAAGCNGIGGSTTTTNNGTTNGNSFVYVGGNVRVGYKGRTVNEVQGGNIFGAGRGASGKNYDVGTINNSNVVVADNCQIEHNVYGGGNYGLSKGEANIYITGGTVDGNVFGGSNMKEGYTPTIYMTGGLVKTGVYGGCNTEGTINNSVTMQINGGQVGVDATHTGNIHGGGYGSATKVSKNVDITLGKTSAARDADGVTVWGDVYGGSALGSVNGTTATNTYHTNVTMNAGNIHGSIYGGALGQKNGVNGATSDIAANVYGPVQVKVYGGSVFNTDGTGANGSGAVYGANNINGAPQRSVTVDIYGTNSAPAEGEYALFSVYGGGNQANYTYGNGYPTVTVHNCDNSIEYVYGGGNAAAVAATDVTIYGGDKIGNVFGGGNGQVKAANVNGNTNVKIYGGTIGDVYGGSNTNGTIGGTISVNVNAQKEDGAEAACPIDIDNVYGGGNKAASAAGNVTIGCAEHIGAVYGGANQANITSNINLSIVSGHIDNVFGGNNTSGNISGTITVTVNDNNSACGMAVGNVYGGGNKAAYGTGTNYPVVNIQNGHLTGSVFGGGLGETAVVTGNPRVTIGQPSAGTVHIDGNVFGGGDAANVVGKPAVLVQNCSTVIGTKDGEGNWNAVGGTVYGGGNAAHVTGSGNGTSVTINGGDINRVFGGGNGEVSPANVEGNAVTKIHAGNIHQAFAGSNMRGNISGSATITVDHSNTGCGEFIDEVYGGGNQAAGNAGTVTIDCGANVGDVYGGANQADINSAITLNITGGTINRVFGGNNTSGNISGAITVNVNKKDACDLDLNYVYGAGNQASYTPSTPGAYPAVNILKGTVKQDVFGGGLGATAVVTSNPTVTVNGGVVSGNVFGGGSEANTVGTTSVTVQAGTVSTDVYGGGALADVEGNTTVAITSGTVTGNAYGGGLGRLEDSGAGITAVAAAVTGNTTVNVSGGTTNNVFGCNNFNGGPQGTVNVTISGGTVTNNVYGGGNLAAASANPIVTINGGTMQDVYGGGLGAPAVITGNTTIAIKKTASTMTVNNVFGGGSAANVAGNTAITMTAGTVSNIYGGGEAADVVGSGETGKTVVNMNGGTVSHSIYGGGLGNTTNVATSTTVTANGGTVTKDVYGGSGFGKVGATTVTINDGATVTRDVFGGGFGQNADAGAGKEAYEADVTGNASVTINKGAVINGNVYGGNNTNGSPKGTITVLVDGPADAGEKAATPLNLKDVFGGGKNAATTSTGAPQVTIQGCETVITRVFGGGDAASAPATNVTIWGGHITSAFAGGNGEVTAADIEGNVNITIKGGTITNVYGGSNTAGNIGGEVNVIVDKVPTACDLDVTNLFGGGNLAPSKGGTLTIACTGDGKIDNVYGGANQADVEGDVTLVINGGNIGNAFGGNNQSGAINGAIRVEVDWTGSTCTNNNLDNVYGGGNLAPYTTPNGKVGPTVQLINATINNNVYGGGLGAPAKVTGDPIVTLEGATVTGNIFGGGDAAPVEGNPTVTATEGSAAKIFGGGKGATAVVTGNPTAVLNKTDDKTLTVTEIYGGGDAAAVSGNTTVTLTKGAVTNAFGGGNAAAINGNTTVSIADATASNVYGGGNLAGVSSTATINMTGGNVTTGLYGGCNSEGTVTGNISVNVTGGQVGTDAEHKANVHGGGYGSATQTAGNVAVAINGASVVVYGDIYGGSALGNVNDNTDDNTTVTITAGTINGDVYGGGLGDASNAALVNGNVAVNINGGSVTGNVFGCNNVNGTPKGSVAVTVAADADATLAEVYGGGNMATYAPTTAQAPVVTINGCGTTIGYVYGGGNAADVPATNVTVWGGTIGNVFGGGHGDKDAVPATAANVTGNVTVNIKGGTITNVFAGSNSKGNIGGTVALSIDKDGTCPMHITDVYGGGNQAAGNAGQITIGCTGGADEGIQNVYGGANAADINSDITLNITGGNINNVFGGNNASGNINGTITVNVDWTGSCGKNYLGNVYGGGRNAAYNAPNGNTDYPKVYVRNATVEHSVFGGGLGEGAIVTGNPKVTIGIGDGSDEAHRSTLNNHRVTINKNVFGGGSAADVQGSTRVNVNAGDFTSPTTNVHIKGHVFGGGEAALVQDSTNVLVKGSTVDGYVYGGGNAGDVGTDQSTQTYTKVIVDQSEVKQDVFGGGLGAPVYGNTAVWIKGENCFIHGSVLGGGFGGDVTGDTHVQIGGDTDKYKKCHLTGGGENCNDN